MLAFIKVRRVTGNGRCQITVFNFANLAQGCHASKPLRGFHASQMIIFWVENLKKN